MQWFIHTLLDQWPSQASLGTKVCLPPQAHLIHSQCAGEANVDERRGDEGAIRYSCTFPGMIRQWREAFKAPDAFFGFVQLSTWCGDPELIAEMRTIGQMAALALPKVGYPTNAGYIDPSPRTVLCHTAG